MTNRRMLSVAAAIWLLQSVSFGQAHLNVISEAEVSRIEQTLSSDAMMGRRTFTPGIEKAADFIASEFKAAGLKPLSGATDFKQAFNMFKASLDKSNTIIDGKEVPVTDIICQSTQPTVQVTPDAGYEIVTIKASDNFRNAYRPLREKKTNLLVLVDTAHRQWFNRLKSFSGPTFGSSNSQVYVLTDNMNPTDYSISLSLKVETLSLANVAGFIPGKSKPDEYVIFSGHYDHLGYGKPDEKGDSLYNGANDDASGTTAVIMLAKYFSKLANNERSLIFVAFTAEEVGGFGSQYFSRQLPPEKVMAMFNIEMIGTDSKWGKESAYLTGYEKTNMGDILAKNLKGTKFSFYPDPYPDQQLFYRSDNATLARLGVPAHTISTSKMDSEPHYHKASDEFETLDMKNMAEVIKSIALSSRSIVAGKDTPTRVNTSDLR